MTDAELQLANDAYDEMDSVLGKANRLRTAEAGWMPDGALEDAEDVHVAIAHTMVLLSRLINQLEGHPEE